MQLSPEAQSEYNCNSWLLFHGVFAPKLLKADSDRCWYALTPDFTEKVAELQKAGVLDICYAKNHGPSVQIGYREATHRTAAQIILHLDKVEMDFDYWRPWDVVGGVGHLFEVITNKFGKKKTDPFKIATALRIRGIHA